MDDFGNILTLDDGPIGNAGGEPSGDAPKVRVHRGWPKGKKRGNRGNKRTNRRTAAARTGGSRRSEEPSVRAAVNDATEKVSYSLADYVAKLGDWAANHYNDHRLRFDQKEIAACVDIPRAFIAEWFPQYNIVLSDRGATLVALLYLLTFVIGSRLLYMQQAIVRERKEQQKRDDPEHQTDVHYLQPIA